MGVEETAHTPDLPLRATSCGLRARAHCLETCMSCSRQVTWFCVDKAAGQQVHNAAVQDFESCMHAVRLRMLPAAPCIHRYTQLKGA